MLETLLLAFIAGCFVAVAGLFWVLIRLVQEQQRHHKLSTRLSHPRKTIAHPRHRELINLLGGDRAIADRLIQLTRTKYPGQTDDWYWDKTIRDLERDRRN